MQMNNRINNDELENVYLQDASNRLTIEHMKVTPRIKEKIAMIIEDSDSDSLAAWRITAEEVLNTLIESGTLDEEYELNNSEGNFDVRRDGLVQAYVLVEIKKQLNR